MFYKLRNIRLEGNEHGKLKKDTIYAELVDENDQLIISATLDHILCSIRNRGLNVRGVSVEWAEKRGAKCSTVAIHNIFCWPPNIELRSER